MSNNRKYKKGAASFYIVAISTLILVIIAASFAAVIISEVTRSTNDDLAQSAYDSALAGVEDAKLTLMNYQKCISENNTSATCTTLVSWIKNGQTPTGENDCDVVANSLGRSIEVHTNADGTEERLGVLVQEGNDNDNLMQQYYTCVKINTKTSDVLGMLNSNDMEHSVRIQFADPADMQRVDRVRLSWHSTTDDGDRRGFKYMDLSHEGPFGVEQMMPAVVSLGMVQTAEEYSLTDFDESDSYGHTDRGLLYFIPNGSAIGSISSNDKYIVPSNNYISAEDGFTKSNAKGTNGKNLPFIIHCDSTHDYACWAEAGIPQPIGGNRSKDTFIFSVALPYGGPTTHFSLEFLDAAGNVLMLEGVQTSIDSTGRANDLFRRVDVRLEPADAAYPYPIYGIQALDPNSNPAIWKDFYTTCEYDFADRTCS